MLRNLPIIILGIGLTAVVGVSCYTYSSNQNRRADTVNTPQGAGTEQNDLAHSVQQSQATKQIPVWRLIVAWPEGVTTLAVLLTLFFIAWQAILTRQSVSDSQEASKRELRAYLTVVIGDAIFQERREKEKGGDLMFECRPLLINTGQTPARKIMFKARAAVMQIPLPKGVHLPDAPDEGSGGSILGPKQDANMFAVVEGFQPDDQVESIKSGGGNRGLYVWGRVTYEDVFGEHHFTQFCQQVHWDLGNNVRGTYIPGRNDAN